MGGQSINAIQCYDWYQIIIQFHLDPSVSGILEIEADRSIDPLREVSRECNGGAEIIFRDDGGGRDIILLFSAIL